MDERQPLLLTPGQPRHPTKEKARFCSDKRGLKILFLTLVFVVLLPTYICRHYFMPYEGETLVWERCGDIKGRPVECSTITVPMDQFNATNSGDKIFTIPLIRLRGKRATQNLLLNPGGPGAAGTEWLFRRGEQLRTIVGEGFHLLTFDPRGMGQSTPQAACYPDAKTRQALGQQARSQRVVEDSAEAFAFAQNLAQACAATMGEHGAYINTPQTAADMNSILAAVGQRDMVYWGFSYGSLLGQTYAALFPERATRVVVDGVINMHDWYGELVTLEDFADTERVFEGFFDECVKAGADCPLAALAGSKEELWEKVMGLAESVYDEPLSVYVNNTAWGTVGYFDIMYRAIFTSLYRPALWYDLADRLAQMLQGNATEAFLNYVATEGALEYMDQGNYFVTNNDGKSGPQYWPKDRATALETLIGPAANSSLFAGIYNGIYYVKQHWTIPKTHTYTPRFGVKTAHPLLILSTTYDPICPLVSARTANKAFADSRIVEVQGYGHCSTSVASTCAAKHIRAFLYNGTLPENYTRCAVEGNQYFNRPGPGGEAARALQAFEDPEDLRIHMAQLELASDPGWPVWSR